jgi:hypothetical protein
VRGCDNKPDAWLWLKLKRGLIYRDPGCAPNRNRTLAYPVFVARTNAGVATGIKAHCAFSRLLEDACIAREVAHEPLKDGSISLLINQVIVFSLFHTAQKCIFPNRISVL